MEHIFLIKWMRRTEIQEGIDKYIYIKKTPIIYIKKLEWQYT